MLTTHYHYYWIKYIKKWFKSNDNLTYEDFLNLQKLVELGYKIDRKQTTMQQIDLIVKSQTLKKEDIERFLENNFAEEDIELYYKLKENKNVKQK